MAYYQAGPRTTMSNAQIADWRLSVGGPQVFEAPPTVAPSRALLQVEQELLQPPPQFGSNPNVRSLEYWAFQYNRNRAFFDHSLAELEKKMKLAEYDARLNPTDATTRKLNEVGSHIAYLYRAAAVAQNRASIGR